MIPEEVVREVGFVHLHVHSSYSLLEGAMTIGALAKLAAADRQPALALTDTNNLFGALEFSEKLAKDGVQPIIGAQLDIDCADHAAPRRGPAQASPHIVLLCATAEGYQNLLKLVSIAYMTPDLGAPPVVPMAALADTPPG